MIPILYDSTETNFTSNGICRLPDCIKCVVTEERNGIYECDFEYPIDGAYFDEIRCGRIIACTHDDTGDIQPFDIVSYSRPLNGVVTFHAVHISYRQTKMVCRGTDIATLSGAFAMLSTAVPSNPFHYQSNISTTATMGAANGVPQTVRKMLGGLEGSILDTFGGEFEWNRFNVNLWQSRGEDKDFEIRYGLNMVSYKDDVDYSETYSSVIPFWSQDNSGTRTTVVGNRVDSGLTTYTGRDDCIPLDLTDKYQSQPTAAQLEDKALKTIQADNINLPKQNIEVNFVQIEKSDEFAEFAEVMKCRLCDRIWVLLPMYNIKARFKIVKTEYDALKGRYQKMELGSPSLSLAEALGLN